jgi:hypothetical protein
MINVKYAQAFVRPALPPSLRTPRDAGEGWGEGNGHGKFHHQGAHLP